ncbi:hypothetical protein BZA70DRAFT_312059 [Myxozyma melibiosi]|uniref:Endoplasmic reticulum lectin n=1 Tax=Myxozyma melibiosi TaxID=54550 RepID=A0ABR1F439_9ASCO
MKMKMRTATKIGLLSLLAGVPALALFSVQDDVLAYPQFKVSMTNEYISDSDAYTLLHSADKSTETYESMMLKGQRYLCALPVVQQQQGGMNESASALTKAEEEKELARAERSGWELLEPLSGTCIYYVAGWWTYAFCHKMEVRQFHQLAPQKGMTVYPPKEDPNIQPYLLGRVPTDSSALDDNGELRVGGETSVQSAGEVRYLVQKIGSGSICELTGRERKIEIQFHCNQNSNDRIAWIKEVTTCCYLMVIHSPRLCQDPAFLPPKEDNANEIKCVEVVGEEEVERRREEREGMAVDGVEREGEITEESTDATTDASDDDEVSTTVDSTEGTTGLPEEASTTAASKSNYRPPRTGPDLETSAMMLIRDIERQIAAGTLLTPQGEVATDADEFSFLVALEDVDGQVIGIVTVKVAEGEVAVEIENTRAAGGEGGGGGGAGAGKQREEEGVMSRISSELMEELREFSGGLAADESLDADEAEETGEDKGELWEDGDEEEEEEEEEDDETETILIFM